MDKANELKTKDGLGLGTLQRPRFSPGLLLEDEDLTAGVNYTRDLTRLLFRSLFGCGVICGLKVSAAPTCKGSKLSVTVAKGIALDCLGNPIEVPAPQTVEYDPECKDFPTEIWVAVCYTEKCCRSKDVACSPDDDGQAQPTRVQSGYSIKLYSSEPACACYCKPEERHQRDTGSSGCCPDGTEEAAPEPGESADMPAAKPAEKPDDCPCYGAHYRGECECDCGCSCVVIGKIDPYKISDKAAAVDSTMVRKIRPVLNGYLQCRDEHAKLSGAGITEQEEELWQAKAAGKPLKAKKAQEKEKSKA